ncbi:MAG TPA: Crp/Fnr family transcriptional regulator [Blastocatellia bacterium]|nr:Crp/Fnr family transcriptional regulator [Blastocatellia bacterium]
MYASGNNVKSKSSTSTARKSNIRATKKRRRTKGPSEKIRSLAALSLAPKVGYLKLADLFGSDDPEFETWINKRLPKRKFKSGELIYSSDQKDPKLFLIKSGSVNIFRHSSIGHRFAIKTLEPGTIFGDMPVLGQSMLGAQAEAAETSEIVTITVNDFEALADSLPKVALNMVRQIGPRLVEAEQRHEQAAFQPVTARVASLLVRLANGANQVIGFTHQEIADLLGVYRETVTNAIGELKQDKLIEVGRKRITLIDTKGLLNLHSF